MNLSENSRYKYFVSRYRPRIYIPGRHGMLWSRWGLWPGHGEQPTRRVEGRGSRQKQPRAVSAALPSDSDWLTQPQARLIQMELRNHEQINQRKETSRRPWNKQQTFSELRSVMRRNELAAWSMQTRVTKSSKSLYDTDLRRTQVWSLRQWAVLAR